MKKQDFMLFVPGPVEIPEEIRSIGSQRLPYMRTSSFGELHHEVVKGLNDLILHKGETLLYTASGTGAMEAAVLSLFEPEEQVVVVNGGTFGQRWLEICNLHKLKTIEIRLEPGKDLSLETLKQHLSETVRGVFINSHETSTGHLYDVQAIGHAIRASNALFIVDAIGSVCADPYRMDEWGVDATILSSQKGLSLPPGMSFLALSERARSKAISVPRRSYYLHAAEYLQNAKRGQAPYTIAIGIMLQLQARLRQIHARGIEALNHAHKTRAEYFRNAVKELPLGLLPARPSNGITALVVRSEKQNAFDIVKRLESEHRIYVAPNAEPLRDKVFRVGHFGDQPIEHLDILVKALKEIFHQG
jgi:aspartate aminotransferase-like enzyme